MAGSKENAAISENTPKIIHQAGITKDGGPVLFLEKQDLKQRIDSEYDNYDFQAQPIAGEATLFWEGFLMSV